MYKNRARVIVVINRCPNFPNEKKQSPEVIMFILIENNKDNVKYERIVVIRGGGGVTESCENFVVTY